MLIEGFSNNLGYKKSVYTNPELELCLLAYIDDRLVGHVSITKRKVVCDSKEYLVGGVGDVIITKQNRKKGFGKKIMEETNEVLKKRGFDLGLLFCHPNLDKFYTKSGWKKKRKGKVYAVKHGKKEDLRRTFFLPLKLSEKEITYWEIEDVHIGKGDW